MKPHGYETSRDKYATDSAGRKVHVAIETVRSSTCPKHGINTSVFEGVVATGWLFRCKGEHVKGGGDTAHLFVAELPEKRDAPKP
jgi:hypothetical protein